LVLQQGLHVPCDQTVCADRVRPARGATENLSPADATNPA
jgi:hypothetical protein